MSKRIILVFAILILAVFIVENIHSVSAFNWNDGTLQAYYKLDDSAGNGGGILDSMGTYNGINNGATFGVAGKINTAYSFNGTNTYINTNYGNGLNLSAFSISLWVRDFDTNGAGILSSRMASVSNELTGFSINSVGIPTFYAWGGNGQQYEIYNLSISLNDTNWHHLVGVFNASNLYFYVDGNLVAMGTMPTTAFFTNNFYIGWDDYNGDSTRYFNGTVDEVGFWNRGLNYLEVQQLYNSGNGLAASILPPQITINLFHPSANSYNSSILPTFFAGNVISNNNTLKNLTMILDGAGNFSTTNTSGANNTMYSFYQILNEGNHTWGFQACDITGYCYTTSYRTLIIDRTAPSINIINPADNYTSTNASIVPTLSPVAFNANVSDILSGIQNVSIYLISPNGTSTINQMYNEGNNSYYYFNYFQNGIWQWYLTSCDLAGNCNTTINRTLIVSIQTGSSGSSGNSGGSSGGGGGGGGGGVAVTVSQSSNSGGGTVITIQANQPIILNVSNSSTGITQVQIVSSQNSSNASITVSPSSIPSQAAIGGETYQTFQITLGGLEEANIINVSIAFKVNKSWMDVNGKDPANVTLFRNTGTDSTPIWTGLLTNLTSQDSDYYYYQSISPGFSTYAVVVGNSSCITGQSRCLVNDLQECNLNQTWATINTCQNGCNLGRCTGTFSIKDLVTGTNVYYFSIGLVVIMGAIVFFIVYRHHKKNSK
jgi:PGF-pre-PGF domain-containing protein